MNRRLKNGCAILVSGIIMTLLACCGNIGYTNQIETKQEYVINTRSGRIHSVTCQYVGQISDKNKKTVSDSLLNLLKEKYIICRKCKAGWQKQGIGGVWDKIAHSNLYYDEISIDSTYDDYIDSIDIVSEWYINHIPTYASNLQTEKLSSYKGSDTHYNEYVLKDKRGTVADYYVITDDLSAYDIENLSGDTQIIRAKETAVQNYVDIYDEIIFKDKIAYYPCNILDSASEYNMPGDDCVRYMFAVLNKMDSEFTKKYSDLSKKKYSNTGSSMLYDDYSDIAYGFTNLGFQIYDVKEGPIRVNNDYIPEGYIYGIDESFQLRKGDILVRKGHVHIYLGNGNAVEAQNFGWGKVNRIYPQTYDIQVIEKEGNYVIELINATGDKDYYTRVYRYIGKTEGSEIYESQ